MMDPRPLLPAAVAVALVLAGCIGPAGDAQERGETLGRIDGAVLDMLLQPWGDVVVEMVEEGRTTRTTPLGGFTFHDVPQGIHTLRAMVPDVGESTQRVLVGAGQPTIVFLQVERPLGDFPHVTVLRHHGSVDLGMPGEECTPCGWYTLIHDPIPKDLWLEARWDDRILVPGAPTTYMRMELQDDQGQVLGSAVGSSPLSVYAHGNDLHEDASKILVRIWFHEENELPHPGFRLDTALRLYYETTLEEERAR